jgi:hypothetical protein
VGALTAALGGGGLALKAAAAVVMELRTAQTGAVPASSRQIENKDSSKSVGYCCTKASFTTNGCNACALVEPADVYLTSWEKCHMKNSTCEHEVCGCGHFCVGTYGGDTTQSTTSAPMGAATAAEDVDRLAKSRQG